MIFAVVSLSLLWLALSQSLDVLSAVVGIVIALGIALLQRRLFPGVAPFVSSLLRRPLQLFAFGATLLWRLVLSTLYTSWLILTGRGEGRLIALPLRVDDPLGRFVLLNSITLTPSTISLLAEDDVVYIHWLQSRGEEADWREAKEKVERRVLALFPRSADADR